MSERRKPRRARADAATVRVAAGGDQALDRPGGALRVARPALQREAAVAVLRGREPRGGPADDARAPLPAAPSACTAAPVSSAPEGPTAGEV